MQDYTYIIKYLGAPTRYLSSFGRDCTLYYWMEAYAQIETVMVELGA